MLSIIENRLRTAIKRKATQYGSVSKLAHALDIKTSTFLATANGQNRPGAETLAKFCNLFPEYTLWIMTGKTTPEAGQTSPDIEQLKELQEKINQ